MSNFVAVMFTDFVAILGIIARNMPLWQRNRKKAKKCVVIMPNIATRDQKSHLLQVVAISQKFMLR